MSREARINGAPLYFTFYNRITSHNGTDQARYAGNYYTVERRSSGDGLTGGRLNRAHEFDSWSIVANIF